LSYEWVEHTSELELHAEGPTPERVLHAAMNALAELLDGAEGPPAVREVELHARDRAGLLVRWLEELVFLAEKDGFVPEEAELVARDSSLEATVRGRTSDPRPLVKAITYHDLEFAPVGDGWRARVVLDV
jgi:SHS2 domain-containing protein